MKAKIPCTECGSTDTFTTPAGSGVAGGKTRYWCMRCVVKKLLDTRRKVRARPTKREVENILRYQHEAIIQLEQQVARLRAEARAELARLEKLIGAVPAARPSMAERIRRYFDANPEATREACAEALGCSVAQVRDVLRRKCKRKKPA